MHSVSITFDKFLAAGPSGSEGGSEPSRVDNVRFFYRFSYSRVSFTTNLCMTQIEIGKPWGELSVPSTEMFCQQNSRDSYGARGGSVSRQTGSATF